MADIRISRILSRILIFGKITANFVIFRLTFSLSPQHSLSCTSKTFGGGFDVYFRH